MITDCAALCALTSKYKYFIKILVIIKDYYNINTESCSIYFSNFPLKNSYKKRDMTTCIERSPMYSFT